jgi:hypothetical protein
MPLMRSDRSANFFRHTRHEPKLSFRFFSVFRGSGLRFFKFYDLEVRVETRSQGFRASEIGFRV